MSNALWQEYVRYGRITKRQFRWRSAIVYCIQVPLYFVVSVLALAISIAGYPVIAYLAYKANKHAFDELEASGYYAEAEENRRQRGGDPRGYPRKPNKRVLVFMATLWPLSMISSVALTMDSLPYKWQDSKNRFVKTGHWKRQPEPEDDGFRPHRLVLEGDGEIHCYPGSQTDAPEDLWADFDATVQPLED